MRRHLPWTLTRNPILQFSLTQICIALTWVGMRRTVCVRQQAHAMDLISLGKPRKQMMDGAIDRRHPLEKLLLQPQGAFIKLLARHD